MTPEIKEQFLAIQSKLIDSLEKDAQAKEQNLSDEQIIKIIGNCLVKVPDHFAGTATQFAAMARSVAEEMDTPI